MFGLLSCSRPSAVYDVGIFGEGSTIADIQSPPQEKSGLVESGRYRIFGSELGLGFTGMYADVPDSSGTSFVMGQGIFAYPPDESSDRISTMISTGPTKMDSCMKIVLLGSNLLLLSILMLAMPLFSKMRIFISLPREPKTYPRPAGESWFVGYGYELLSVWVIIHTNLIFGAKNLKRFNCLYGWLARKKLLWVLFHFPLKVRFNFPNPYKM